MTQAFSQDSGQGSSGTDPVGAILARLNLSEIPEEGNEGEVTCIHHRGEPVPCFVCAELEEEKRKSSDRAKKADIEKRFGAIRLGARYANARFSDFIPPSEDAKGVLSQCRDFVSEFAKHLDRGTIVLMSGNPGTGKNLLSAAICNQIAEMGYNPLHTTAIKSVRKITDNWQAGKDRTPEQEIIDSFLFPDLLVLDEIGVQFGSSKELIYLTEIISERYENFKPTIIISNLPASEVCRLLGPRIASRINAKENILMKFTWGSAR